MEFDIDVLMVLVLMVTMSAEYILMGKGQV